MAYHILCRHITYKAKINPFKNTKINICRPFSSYNKPFNKTAVQPIGNYGKYGISQRLFINIEMIRKA